MIVYFCLCGIALSKSDLSKAQDILNKDYPSRRIVIDETFKTPSLPKIWETVFMNPKGTMRLEKGWLKTEVDPGPSALVLRTRDAFYIKSAEFDADVVFVDGHADRAGVIIGFYNEHYVMSFIWYANGQIRRAYGDSALNPPEKEVACCTIPAPGRSHHIDLSMDDTRLAVLRIDGKEVYRFKQDLAEAPPAKLFISTQNQDNERRHINYGNIHAKIETYTPKVRVGGSFSLYRNDLRKKLTLKALSVKPLLVIVLLICLAAPAVFAALIAFELRNIVLKNIFLIVSGFFLAIFLLELSFQMIFFHGYVAARFQKVAYSHDGDGFHYRTIFKTVAPDGDELWFYDDIDKQINKIGDKPVILITGDSITYGSGVDNEEQTFSYLLRQQLKKRGYDIEVLNLSSPGYSTRDERWVLELFTRNLNVKAVIVGFFYDDFSGYRYFKGYLWNQSVVEIDGDLTIESLPVSRSLNNLLFHTSSFYQWLAFRQMKRIESDKHIAHGKLVRWEQNVSALKRISDGHNAPLYMILMPMQTPRLDIEKGGRFPLPYVLRYDDVERSAARKGITTVRLDSLLGHPENYSAISSDNVCHYNSKGHILIADVLTDYLERNILKRKADPSRTSGGRMMNIK